MSRRVITYGTFDLFHVGHLRLLQRLKALGDYLVVAVSTDEFNVVKGKRCAIPFLERVEIIEGLRCVDHVIPEENWNQKPDDIERLGIDIFGMGSDWQGKFDELKQYCEVVYLPRTEGISTSEIKVALRAPPIQQASQESPSQEGR